MPQYSVAAFGKGTTIACKLRLALEHLCASERTIYSVHYTCMRLALTLVLALSALLGVFPVHAQLYQVRFDHSLKALYVRACFEAGAGFSLRAADSDASDYLLFAQYGDNNRVQMSRNRMQIPAASQERCIRYGVDMEKAGKNPSLHTAYPLHDAWLSWSGVWLWRPRGSITGAPIRFFHDPGYAVSAPWPLVSRDAGMTEFRFGSTPSDWTDLVAFGRFEPRLISVPGGSLRLSILPGNPAVDNQAMQQWVYQIGDAISSIFGHLPIDAPQVLVVPINRGNGPVPWGQVRRGGGASVHLFVNQTLELDTFLADWTASHEFSHLFHPYMGRDGRWLAEGIASYYQNISRARVGQMTQLAAWQKLHAGFGRGRKASGKRTLRQVNRRISEQGGYMRIYWTGAAVAMLADVELRQQSKGRVSLDTVLAEFASCHLPSEKLWRVEDFLATLDEIGESDIFMSLYHRYADSARFPDLASAYQQLGLSVGRDNKLQLGDDPPGLSLRTSMTGARFNPQQVVACPSDQSPVG
jgi:hypothetical protein